MCYILHLGLIGDSCNLVGCILSGEQLPTTTFLAAYFVLADIIMLAQVTYWQLIFKVYDQHRSPAFHPFPSLYDELLMFVKPSPCSCPFQYHYYNILSYQRLSSSQSIEGAFSASSAHASSLDEHRVPTVGDSVKLYVSHFLTNAWDFYSSNKRMPWLCTCTTFLFHP